MYHHKPQSQGPKSFSNMPMPDHHQASKQSNSTTSNMLSGFPFRHTQLPDALESALAIHGARDTDCRHTHHASRTNEHQTQDTMSVVSQLGGYSSIPKILTSDNQTSHHQRANWSNFKPPSKLLANSAPDSTYHTEHNENLNQQAETNRTGSAISSWVSSGSSSSQFQQLHSVVGDCQGLYTPESAGSILASFGLSNNDLEVLSHYPDDQLTPDTLPFILRDIQINKSENQNTVACNTHKPPLLSNTSHQIHTCSSEVPSLLVVTKTAGKVIDYGHTSRAKENTTEEIFKREKLSSERMVQMYTSVSAPNVEEKAEKHHMPLVHTNLSEHGDQDYRRTSGDHHKNSLSPSIEGPPSKYCIVDKDYRLSRFKQRPSTKLAREVYSRRSISSFYGKGEHGMNKKFPNSIFINDFFGTSPKEFPHSCSLCHIQCDHNKDWVDHINTVNHTASCRDLRNKYPDWKPNLKRKNGAEPHRLHASPYSPQDYRQQNGIGDSLCHSSLKRPYNDLSKQSIETTSNASFSKANQSSKHGTSSSSNQTVKKPMKVGTKTNKIASAKVICEMAAGVVALSVYKHFQRFPCIIQNNPLYFSCKPDPKADAQTQVLSPNLQSPEDNHANDEDHYTEAAEEDEIAYEEHVSVEMEKKDDIFLGPQKVANIDKLAEENASLVTHEPGNVLFELAFDTDKKTFKENVSSTKSVLESDKNDASANETVSQTYSNAAELKKDHAHVGQYSNTEIAISNFKNTLEVKDDARSNYPPNKVAHSANGDEVHLETKREKPTHETNERGRQLVVEAKGAKIPTDGGYKSQEWERTEKEARKVKEVKERKQKVIKIRDQKKLQRPNWNLEKEERTKNEMTKARRQKEHGFGSNIVFETFMTNSNMRDEKMSDKSDAQQPKIDEDEDFDSFRLSMRDFVTVDEVGDVTDLNDFSYTHSPSAPEKTTEQEHSLKYLPQDIDEVNHLEETEGVIVRPMKSDDPITDSQHQPMTSDEPITDFGLQPTTSSMSSDCVSSNVISMLSCKAETQSIQTQQEFSPVRQKEVPTCQPKQNESATITSVSKGSMITVEALATPLISVSTVVSIDDTPSGQYSNKMKMTTEGTEKMQITEWTKLPPNEPGRQKTDIPTITEEKSEDNLLRTKTSMATANTAQFDPSRPVGMEFLVPKTGFFCKVCHRFFTGNKDNQITHCKSLKHFENLQKYMKTRKPKSQ